MINRIAELSEDIEIVQMKDEENLINTIKESPDNHALVVPTPSEPIDEKYEAASKYELEEQCHQINNAEDKTEADILEDTENLQILPEKMEIPEIVDHNDGPATAKVRSKDTLERSIQNTGMLVEKANNNGIGEEQENVCLIINSEDTADVDVHKEKGNTMMLDIDSDMGPEEQGQLAISEKESVKVEQIQILQNDAQCSIIKEMTNETAPGSSVEHNIKETAYKFGIDEQLETTSRSENINDEVHQDVQEEPLNKIHEKSVSSKNENLAEVDSEREMLAAEAKDANLVRIAYEETKELEEEIPATTFTGQNSEKKVVDGIKRGTTTEEVEESKTTTVAHNSETLVEMKSDKVQLPGDAIQTMEAKGQGDRTYTTIKEDDSNILDPIIVEKDTKNQDENTNEILDPLPITSALTDGAAYGSLHSDQDGSTIKADHSIDEIPNQEVDFELRSVGQNVEVTIEAGPIKLDIPENDGMEGDELSIASEDKLERLEFERKEMTRMKEEALDACPSQVKEPTEDAEVEHISLQTIENEGVAVTEAEVKGSDLMSQENIEIGLSTTEALLEENMPESASTVLSEGQSLNVPTHINMAEMIILEDETEEVQLQVQESLNDEVQNEKQEEKSEVKADQIESQTNTNDTNEKEKQGPKVASHKAKLEEGELENPIHEVSKEIETTETENIYEDRIEKQNLDEDMQMDGNELLKDSTTELEGGNNEPIHVSDATEDAIPHEEHEESKCKIVDDLSAVSHKLVEESNKMETSDHQQMKNTEPEILEKGGETSDGTITQNNEILQTSEKSDADADVQNDANEHVQQLEGLSSTISNNLEIAETMEYIEKNSEAEEEAFRAQIIASLREVTANEQFGEENDSNKQNKPETNRKSEITITAPDDEVEISEDKHESEEALNANEIDIEIPKESTTIGCKMVDDLPVANHQLVEEPKKMETSSDHQQMKHPEPEILEKGDETSEGMSTKNNEILETSSKSDAHIQNGANEHVQLEGLSSTISNNLEVAVSMEFIEKKNNEAEEEAFRAQMIASLREVTANKQFQEEENDSNKQKEPETNWKSEINITVLNDEVETSEDKPESEEALNANELDIEIPKEKISSTECPTEVEQLACSIGYPASVPGVNVNSEEIPDVVPSVISVTKSSEKDKNEEDVKNLTEVSILQSHEEEDRKDISSAEVTESKESPHKMSTMLEPELCQPEEKREMKQVEEEASYGVECDASQDAQTQQIDHHDLPVSQLLMDHILREEVIHTACNVEAEDDNHEGTDGVKQHDAGVLKGACNVSPKEFQNTSENVESQDKIQEKNDDGDENGTKIQKEEILDFLTPEQTASTTENKVGQENESSSPLVEEKKTSDANEKIEIPAVKDDEETYSILQDSSLIMAVAEDVKDEIPKMSEESIPAKDIKDEMPSMSEESTPVLVNDSREPTIKDEEETHSNFQDSSTIMTVAEDIKDEIPSMSEEPTPVLVNDTREPTIKDDEKTHSNLQDSSPTMAVAEDVKDEIPRMPEKSTPTEDVNDEIPSTSEESSHVLVNDSREPTVKDDEETHSNLQDSSPKMAVAEDVKDEIPIMSEESTPVLVNDSREPTSTEERSTETKTGIEECMDPTLVQDEKVQGSILEMCAVEQEINRSVESLNKDVNLSSTAKTYAEDDLLEEGKVIPQDVEKSDEASYAVMEGHYHSNAESVAEKKNLVHKEETLPDHRYDQYGRLSQSSHLQDDLLGQTLEIDPKVKKIDIEDKDSDDFPEIQAQQEKNKSGEITYLSGPEDVEQSNFAVKCKDEILEVTENLLEDRSLSSDEKEAVETKETQVYEDKLEDEKEHKTEESVQDERIVGEARDAELKPAHKKSHNILSGVGSKVKHSLAKVKKAITGKSSHSKATPAN
ncbi:uncharacterized protein M6B38_286870 [Iris pallida]|uniref:Uncharacterized protein n=1 Tax=Iris pallida TaxID=29817 RepID=A0AAX6HXG3_IRIPA|nr:uncharacterized protein M6B38_286870 [Iris pallida]